MNFRDMVSADIDDVFLDAEEHAEMHNLNGQQLLCIVDEDINKIRTGRESEDYDGISLTVKRIFVKIADLPKRPQRGKLFKFDDSPYVVVDCADSAGMYEITLGLNDT